MLKTTRLTVISIRLQCRYQSTLNGRNKNDNVRWFYATDVPLSKPAYFHHKPTKEAKKYEPFSPSDSAKLEKKYKEKQKNQPITVKEDGLFQVDLPTRQLSPVYWDGPTYAVRRGTWFYTNHVPVNESIAKEVEELYSTFAKADEKDRDENQSFELQSMKTGTVKFSKDLKAAWLSSKDTNTFEILTNFGGGTKVIRGFNEDKAKKNKDDGVFSALGSKIENIVDPGNRENNVEKSLEAQIKYDVETDDNKRQEDREIDHLVLCVHGIGQRLSQKFETVNFVHDINVFRKLLNQVFEKREELQHLVYPSASLKEDGKSKKPKNHKVQVLPVLWRHDINFDMTKEDITDEMKVTLEDITIDAITALRSMVGDVILDVLLYHQPHYKEQIISAVIHQLNKIVRKFEARNNKPVEKISLIGHSLGSAIVHDILQRDRITTRGDEPSKKGIEFDVDKYFAIGSPLGLFRLLEKEKVKKSNVNEIYNVFHPCDPVAYRIEPLINLESAAIPPAMVPYVQGGLKTQLEELSQLGQKISASANSIWTNVTMPFSKQKIQQMTQAAKSEESENPVDSLKEKEDDKSKKIREKIEQELKFINSTGRVDYVLQEGVLDISLVAAIASHMSYFENEDVASFILKSLYNS